MVKGNLIAMLWNPSDMSCYTSFAVPSRGKIARLQPEKRSTSLCGRWKRQLVPKNSAIVSQRDLQHILIASVLSNLETSLDIPTCAESSNNLFSQEGFEWDKVFDWTILKHSMAQTSATESLWSMCNAQLRSKGLQRRACEMSVFSYSLALGYNFGRRWSSLIIKRYFYVFHLIRFWVGRWGFLFGHWEFIFKRWGFPLQREWKRGIHSQDPEDPSFLFC